MKADDTDDRAANSQEIIDASFELGSSSLELGSYYQNAKQEDDSQAPRRTVQLEHVVNRAKDESEIEEDASDDAAKLECVAKVLGLLEVAVHVILHARQVYPEELFSRRKKFGRVAFQCIDAAISEYVSSVLEVVRNVLLQEEIERLIFNIHQFEEVIESFVFVFAYNRARISKAADNIPEGKQLQSMLRKLNAMDALLEPLTDCDQSTFSILMQIRGNSERLGSLVKPFEQNPKISASLIQIIAFPPFEVSLYLQQVDTKAKVDTMRSLEL